MNKNSINIHMQGFFVCVDVSFQLIWVKIKDHDYWFYGKTFTFVRTSQTLFQSDYTIITLLVIRVPVSLHL